MNAETLFLDTSLVGTSQRVLPIPPVLESDPHHWPGICAELHRQPPHQTPVHSTSSIILCLHTGEPTDVEWWIDNHHHCGRLVYNQMTLYPADVDRAARWEQDKHFLLLCLQHNFVTEILGDEATIDRSRLVPQLGIYDPFVRELGQLFRQQLQQGDEDQSLYIESLALALGVYLTQHYSESMLPIKVTSKGLPANQIQQVKDYIDAHLAEAIRLKDMANLLGLSTFHFSRQFKEATHMAPYQFVMHTRIEQAKEMLRSRSQLNISDIASVCGFSNQSHFANHFRKFEGVSPSTYRQDFV